MNRTQDSGLRTEPATLLTYGAGDFWKYPQTFFLAAFLVLSPRSPVLSLATDVPADRMITLDESVRLAMNNSQLLLTSHEDVEIALQRVQESESLFFPKLDLNTNWSKFSVGSDRPLLLEPALGPTLIDSSPRQNFYTARANIYQTVYEGGRLRNTWRQARISFERAKSINEALRIGVASAAKQAFYDLLFAQEKAHQYQALIERLQPFLLHSRGGALYERIRVEDEIGALRALSAEARLAQQQATLAYLRALNLELNTTVQLKGLLEPNPRELDLQKMLAWASQYRSELRQTEYQQELDALGVSLSRAERTPTVGFGATYERAGNDLNTTVPNWAGTLNVNLPISISDMFFGFSKVRERRALYRQATLKHAETADQIQMQVRDAYMKYRFWQGELQPRQDDRAHLQDMVTALRKSAAGPFERAQAERVLLESQVRFEEAVHNQLVSLAALEQAVGHSLDEQ